MYKNWENSLKNIVHEKPKVHRSDNSPITSLSSSLILILKSGEVLIGSYNEVEGKDFFYVHTGRCSAVQVPDDNPVLFWKYLEGTPLTMYKCGCRGYDGRRDDGFIRTGSHVIGTFGCLYKVVYQEEEPRSDEKGNWYLSGKEISNKELFEEKGYRFVDGCWRRLKTEGELEAEAEYFKKYLKEEPFEMSFKE